MKRIFYLLFFLMSVTISGQRGYYITDTLLTVGVKINVSGAVQNAQYCNVEGKNNFLRFSPDEVQEYGIINGKEYISRAINIEGNEKKVFLERLNKGKLNFFYYKYKNGSSFFLEKDSGQLVEVLKKGSDDRIYKDVLEAYTLDCNFVSAALKLVKYNKASLSEFIDQYNSCSVRPFPFTRYGLITGFGAFVPTNCDASEEVFRTASFKNDYTFGLGMFADIPIVHSYFSFHPEIYFQKNAFSSHYMSSNIVYDIIVNATSINIPLLGRYTFPSSKFRPYLNAGTAFSYNIRNDNAVYVSTISGDIIEIEEVNKNEVYSKFMAGYTAGAGMQYDIDYRRSVFFELRHNNLSDLTHETYGIRSFHCLIGINF